MEIENTTLGGNYSQKVHFRTHHFGGTNGKRLTITEKGHVAHNTNGNYELCYKKGSASTIYYAFTVSRNDECVTFTNTTCASDDRLKFNERNIENALESIMKLSPEIYDKVF